MNKQMVANMILRQSNLSVHFDPRNLAVKLPRHLRKQSSVRLDFGLAMPVPIPDLEIDERGIRGTLSFAGTPFKCDVPWMTVFALVGDWGQGQVWAADMPIEMVREIEKEAEAQEEVPTRKHNAQEEIPTKKYPALRLVK